MTPRSWTLRCASQRVVRLSDVKMNTVCMSLVALKETIRLNPLIGENTPQCHAHRGVRIF